MTFGLPSRLAVQIAGTGHALPKTRVSSEELDRRLGFVPGRLEALSGVRARFVCEDEGQIDIAVAAAQGAMDDAGCRADDIDLVLGACAVPYQPLPATAPLVMARLGLRDGAAAAFDVNATCLSFLSALELAASRLALGQSTCALVIASEVASRALPWDDQPDVAALFGDGAAAAILRRADTEGPAVLASLMRSYPSHYDACQIGAGGTRFDYRTQREAFEAHSLFRMDGKQLFRITHQHFPGFVSDLLAKAGWQAGDVDMIVPHQASPAALRHMVARTGLCAERVVDIAAEYGNQIAASIPTALDVARRQGRVGAGSRILMLGTSAGVSFGGMAVRL